MGECCSKSTVTKTEQEAQESLRPISMDSHLKLTQAPSVTLNENQIEEVLTRFSQFPLSKSKINQQNKLTKVECPSHKGKYLDRLQLSDYSLKCFQCTQEQYLNQDNLIQLNDIFQMEDKDYLKNFLKIKVSQINQKNSKWYGKEKENSELNMQILTDMKDKINQEIDRQIQEIKESSEILQQRRSTLSQMKENCNNLDKCKQYLSRQQTAEEMQQNILILQQKQKESNKQFELEFQMYNDILKNQVDKQNNILRNSIPQIKNVIERVQRELQTNHTNLFNLITGVEQFRKDNSHLGEYQINVNEQGFIQMQANNQNSYFYQINYNLNDGKKYEILMDIARNDFSNTIELFLLPSSDLNKQQKESKLFFSYRKEINDINPNSQTNQIQGQTILRCKEQKIQNLKLQIDLKNNIYRCQFGNNKNIITNSAYFKNNEKYFFSIYTLVEKLQVEISLKYMKEVENFEDWQS